MDPRCPGQDGKNLKSSLYRCPNCGNTVEIFSDEKQFKCSKCKTVVRNKAFFSCLEWCSSAEKCKKEKGLP